MKHEPFRNTSTYGKHPKYNTDTQAVPYHVKHAALTQWDLPFSLVDYWFDKYYILVWDGKYLQQKILSESSLYTHEIKHDKIFYTCNWISPPAECFKSPKVSVSLRRIYGESTGYALIKVKGY